MTRAVRARLWSIASLYRMPAQRDNAKNHEPDKLGRFRLASREAAVQCESWADRGRGWM